jgi:beta-phosphoglucomutase
MIQACIFDMDGVLVDTAKYHFQAWQKLAGQLGFSFTAEHNELLKGVSRMRSLEIILDMSGISLSMAEKEHYCELKNGWFLEYVHQMDEREIFPGVVEFLKELNARKVPISLGSASKNAPEILQKTGLAQYFDQVVDGSMVTEAKPAPDIFLCAARLLNTPPEHCLVFEDAAAGVEAARRAGMKCIGVGLPDALPGADFWITDFTGLDTQRALAL